MHASRQDSHRPGYVEFIFCPAPPAPGWRGAVAHWLTRKLSGSDLTHVAVSDGEAVLSMRFDGKRYYPRLAFERLERGMWLVVHAGPIVPDLDKFGQDKPLSVVRSLLRHLSGGMIPANDCVSVACDVLRAMGHNVPRRVTTPVALLEWIRMNT